MGLDWANPQATYTCQPLLVVVLAELFPVALHLLETWMTVNKTSCQ